MYSLLDILAHLVHSYPLTQSLMLTVQRILLGNFCMAYLLRVGECQLHDHVTSQQGARIVRLLCAVAMLASQLSPGLRLSES